MRGRNEKVHFGLRISGYQHKENPVATVYKLFKQRKDGSLGPLFINRKLRVPVGEWMEAEDHPTKGFAHRPGWHCTYLPHAPHIMLEPKVGPKRVWAECEARGTKTYKRPESQGGKWVLADELKVVRVLDAEDVEIINKLAAIKTVDDIIRTDPLNLLGTVR